MAFTRSLFLGLIFYRFCCVIIGSGIIGEIQVVTAQPVNSKLFQNLECVFHLDNFPGIFFLSFLLNQYFRYHLNTSEWVFCNIRCFSCLCLIFMLGC